MMKRFFTVILSVVFIVLLIPLAVVEIMKNRDLGVVDEMIKLYFDRRSRTMSDVKGLPPQHAWSEKIEQMLMEGFTRVNQGELPMEWR